MKLSFALPTAFALLSLLPAPARAQSQMHPRWEIPGFDFRKDGAWRVRARRVSELRGLLLAQGRIGALNAPMLAASPVPSAAAVTGTVLVPSLFFSYQGIDSSLFMRDTAQYTAALFGAAPPSGNPYTLRTYYEQMSNSSFSMQGRIIGWVRLDSAEVTYTGVPGTCSGNPFGTTNCNGLFSQDAVKRMQNGFRQALGRVDTGASGVNFALFDNNGPDLIPNSGDDDGYVDMIMFAHPTKDGACGGATNNHIWSHRYVLANANQTNFQDFVTNDAKAGGGFIRISDYFATSALGGATSCDSTQIMPIGTAAHEFGHALGLPDLYDTQGSTEGIGRWGLMGAGNFSSPASPGRMEAWSLNQLGWVTVVPLATTGTYSFGAAALSDTTFLVNVQGMNTRNEYFLLENRQASLADTALIANACLVWYQTPTACPGGLLIWHVDGSIMGGGGNALNAGAIHGLRLEEGDGALDLWCPGAVPTDCNRGDAGDVYPGTTGNTAFAFTTLPAAVKNLDGSFVGFAIDSIRQVVPGGTMAFRLVLATALAVTSGTTRPNGVMGATYADTLRATGGDGSYSWSVVGGALPSGVTLAATGVLSGFPSQTGAFSYQARVASGGQLNTQTYTFSVSAPTLATADVVNQLLTGTSPLTADGLRYLDFLGNNNSGFDIGDFLAWVKATGAPLSAEVMARLAQPKNGGRP